MADSTVERRLPAPSRSTQGRAAKPVRRFASDCRGLDFKPINASGPDAHGTDRVQLTVRSEGTAGSNGTRLALHQSCSSA